MAYQVPPSIGPILPPLAEAVLPVQAWTKQKAAPKYDQLIPPLTSVPWRPVTADPILNTASFDIVRFLEILTDTDGVNVALAPRWNAIQKDPTKYFQHPSGKPPAQWRADRQGLTPDAAKFGVFDPESSNFAFVGRRPDKTTKAMSRMDFYDSCWTPLEKAYLLKPPSDAAGWIAFRDNLRTDQFPDSVWPSANDVRSSVFIRQFTVDVLNACLGQHNGAIAAANSILQRAVLVEAGENRFPGNQYAVKDAAQAVNTFSKTI